MRKPTALVLVAGGALAAGGLWWRGHPSACPYGQRFWLAPPRPVITRRRLCDVLKPRPGERVLEVGSGTGYYTLDVAHRVGPHGRVEIVDVQQRMLDHTLRRATERGLSNIAAARADARELPYPDASFDAAFLVTVLGEVPDQEAALRELARVLKPGGWLVVGELFGDPHWVSPKRLARLAEGAGLRFARRSGGPLGYFTRYEHRPPG